MVAPPCLVQGELHADRAGLIDGWCLWPDRPGARATVEIAIDSVPVAAVQAARYFDGVGDGAHGFSLSLPGALAKSGTSVVEARETASGTLFGRVVLSPADIGQPAEDRLGRLDLRALNQWAPPADDAGLKSILAALGAILTGLDAGWVRRERNRLTRTAPRLKLSRQPELSIVVPVSDVLATTLGQLAAVPALCDRCPVEVILADDGADARHLLLVHAVPGLRYMRVPRGLQGATLNALAGEARGAAICFLQPGAHPGNWMWPDGGCAVHLGGAAACGIPRPSVPPPSRRAPHGFALYVPRGSLAIVGGFDAALRADTAYRDLALRCSVLKIPLAVWLDPAL